MPTKTDTPRVYIACLAAHNEGKLHGEWVDAVDVDEMQDAVARVLSTSPVPGAEEYAIHDTDNFQGVDIGEHEPLPDVAAKGAFLAKHGELGAKVLADENDLERATKALEERYCGAFQSLEDWAENFLDDQGLFGRVDETLKMYFDFEKYARDAELSGDIYSVETRDGMVHVFHNS